MTRRGADEALQLVGRIKCHAVFLIADQAFEGSPDFQEKLQSLKALTLGPLAGVESWTQLAAPPEASLNVVNTPQLTPAVPAVTEGTAQSDAGLIASNEKLTVKALCARFNVSRRCLMRLFEEHERRSPGAWARSVRLAAARMLHDEGCPFSVMAARLGYSSRSSIWRLVKRGKMLEPSDRLPL